MERETSERVPLPGTAQGCALAAQVPLPLAAEIQHRLLLGWPTPRWGNTRDTRTSLDARVGAT